MVVVPGALLVVAVLVTVAVEVVEVVLLELELVDVDEVVVEVVVDEVEVVVWLQALLASTATVETAWLRFVDTVLLTVEGRLATALDSLPFAAATELQLCAETAEETASRWLLKFAA